MRKLPRVLIVEDEPAIAELIAVNLRHNGFQPFWAEDGDSAQRELDAVLPDVILLDWMLPGQSGLSLARKWRADSRTKPIPILMLTARGDEPDKIAGLDAGADDYITKPFSTQELLARIRAVLRRAEGAGERTAPASGFRFAGWMLETARRRLLDPAGVEVALTGNEYELLVALLERAGRVLTRDILLDLVHGRSTGPFDRAVDVAVSRLRRKLDDDGKAPGLIKTVRGGGYVLAVPVERVG